MGELMFACPNKGKVVSTGIDVAAADFAKMQNQRTFTQCPHCRMVHSWMTSDAWLKATETEIADDSALNDSREMKNQTDEQLSQWVVDL